MKRFALLISVSILSGCVALGDGVVVKPFSLDKPEPSVSITETTSYTYKIKTNYKLLEPKTSNIGSAMVKVEDYMVNDIVKVIVKEIITNDIKFDSISSIKAIHDFEITGSFKSRKFTPSVDEHYKYSAGSIFDVDGYLDGTDYYVIGMNKSQYKFLVDKQGYLVSDKFLERDNTHFHYTDTYMIFNPVSIKFVFDQETKYPLTLNTHQEKQQFVSKSKSVPEVNYELIYGGKDSSGLHIVYREYTSEGIARQAFYQNLNYENTAKTIKFKNTSIEVLSANNEQIVFKVLEDDINELEKIGNALLPVSKSIKIK